MRAVAVVFAILAIAGCSAPAATVVPASAPASPLDTMGMPLAPLALSGSSCVWGGGHSIHTFALADIVPAPWKPADVIEDIGVQPTYSDPGEQTYGVATTGWGNWHTNLLCKAWTGAPSALTLGMVLARVEPPPFDPHPVARNYIVNVIASDDKALNDELMMEGWMSMGATGQLSWQNGVFHHVLATDMHGTYESLFRTRATSALNDSIVRLWFQKPNANGTFSPIAIDMTLSGDRSTAIADPEGYFSHTGTDDHVIVAGQPQGVAGQIAGFVVSDFDVAFSWGPTPSTSLEKAYSHL